MTTKTPYQCPPCSYCRDAEVLLLDTEALEKWKGGMLLQDAFPEMTPADREVIKSGIHPQCWKDMFGDPFADDEEEEGAE